VGYVFSSDLPVSLLLFLVSPSIPNSYLFVLLAIALSLGPMLWKGSEQKEAEQR
jgi:hypothetical protein